jgi:chemotaxis protein methyltransferase CheR
MTPKISDELLAQFSAFLTAKLGLSFPPNRWPDLGRGIKSAARELGFASAELGIRRLLSSQLTRKQIEVLASHLTVGETYFFREPKSLAVLTNHILPELIREQRQKGRRLRIWSAGCASGEEAYTIAMLLSQAIADLKSWQIHLLATDINPQALKKGARGIYNQWSFRATPPELIERYFVRRDRHWEILPHLKQMVTFAYHNLVADPYPALANHTLAMDLIFCRNVLMYFSPGQAKTVLQNLNGSLVEGGWLMVSATETSHVRHAPLRTVNFPGATVYRRDSRPAPAREVMGAAALLGSGKTCAAPQPAADYASHKKGAPAFPEIQEAAGTRPTWAEPSEPPPRPASLPESPPGPVDHDVAATGTDSGKDPGKEMVLRARNCADQGDLAVALLWCEKAVAADRLNPALHYLHAAILQEQDALAEAAGSLRTALYLDQNFVLAHFALGNLALLQGDAKGARKHYENVLALLNSHQQDDLLPESEGITAGRLREIVLSTMAMRQLGERKASRR